MFKKISTICICFLLGVSVFSCKKKLSRQELEENLKTAMELSLNNQPRIDTSRTKFKVNEVKFYEGKKVYNCEFKVNMKQQLPDRLVDTVGYMSADISKDFKTVSRKY
jgi:hypothetical protein